MTSSASLSQAAFRALRSKHWNWNERDVERLEAIRQIDAMHKGLLLQLGLDVLAILIDREAQKIVAGLVVDRHIQLDATLKVRHRKGDQRLDVLARLVVEAIFHRHLFRRHIELLFRHFDIVGLDEFETAGLHLGGGVICKCRGHHAPRPSAASAKSACTVFVMSVCPLKPWTDDKHGARVPAR